MSNRPPRKQMARITLAEVDKKIDLVLQEIGFIKTEQKRATTEFVTHTAQDEIRFNLLTTGQSDSRLQVELIKQEQLTSKRGFLLNWTTAGTIFVTILGAVLTYVFTR